VFLQHAKQLQAPFKVLLYIFTYPCKNLKDYGIGAFASLNWSAIKTLINKYKIKSKTIKNIYKNLFNGKREKKKVEKN